MINEYKKNPTVPGPDERYVSDEVNHVTTSPVCSPQFNNTRPKCLSVLIVWLLMPAPLPLSLSQQTNKDIFEKGQHGQIQKSPEPLFHPDHFSRY